MSQDIAEIKTATYFKSIYDLPLSKFIECIVDNNISALTISGFPTQEELLDAWDFILGQYSENVGRHEYKMFMQLRREIADMEISLTQIRLIAAKGNDPFEEKGILRLAYVEFFASELDRIFKTAFTLNWKDQKTYNAQLDKCVNRSKAIKISLDVKRMHFAAIEKKNEGKQGDKMDRKYFTSILVTLSDHATYRIDESIKMSEYCERIKRFTDYCELQAKKVKTKK